MFDNQSHSYYISLQSSALLFYTLVISFVLEDFLCKDQIEELFIVNGLSYLLPTHNTNIVNFHTLISIF